MEFIKNIKNLFVREIRNPVGRWKIETCNKKLNHKIDLSNEDHCGPCGQYSSQKLKDNQDKK